jgi:hypothetical protein
MNRLKLTRYTADEVKQLRFYSPLFYLQSMPGAKVDKTHDQLLSIMLAKINAMKTDP